MNRRLIILALIILAIPALAFAYWLGSPLFREDEVSEDLPDDIVFVTSTPAELQDAPVIETPTAAVVDTALAEADAAATQQAAAEITAPVEEPMMDEQQVTATELLRGTFRDADSFHQGSGDAILFSLSDGRHLLRFENFSVTNGPDLQVYLVPRKNDGSVDVSGYIDLGQLKGNVGDQNYFIEADVEIPAEASIVIWCEPFAVLFSVASLQ